MYGTPFKITTFSMPFWVSSLVRRLQYGQVWVVSTTHSVFSAGYMSTIYLYPTICAEALILFPHLGHWGSRSVIFFPSTSMDVELREERKRVV